jgi:hypothetical protein
MEMDEQRIYLGDCGCIRVESKHFRATMQPEQFVEMLREIVKKQKKKPLFCQSLKISNNVNSSGMVTIQNKRSKKL